MSQMSRADRLAQAQQLEYERKMRQKRMLLDKRVPNASQGVKDSWDANIERDVLMDADRGYGTQRGAAANALADKLRAEREATQGYRQSMTNATRGSEVAMAAQPQRDSDALERLRAIEATGGDIRNRYNEQEIGVRRDIVGQGLSDARAMQPINVGRGNAEIAGMNAQTEGINQQNLRAREFNRAATPSQAAAAAAIAESEALRAKRDASMFANQGTAFANMPPTLNPEYVESQARADKAKAEASFADTTARAAATKPTGFAPGALTPQQAQQRIEQRNALIDLYNLGEQRRLQTSDALSALPSQMSSVTRGDVVGSGFTGSAEDAIGITSQLEGVIADIERLAEVDPEAAADQARQIIEGLPIAGESGEYGSMMPMGSFAAGPLTLFPSIANVNQRREAAKRLTEVRKKAESLRAPRRVPPARGE